MRAHKVQIKFYVRDPNAFQLEPIVPVLHDWIKGKSLDDLLIDVADYGHVKDGPGLLLVGHSSDYYLDLGEGRPGLLYSRKRDAADDPVERVLDALRRALIACRKLEDSKLEPPVAFRADEVLFRINDRLLAPNDDATLTEVTPVLQAAFAKLYGGEPFTLEREGSERELFTVRVKAARAPAARELAKRML